MGIELEAVELASDVGLIACLAVDVDEFTRAAQLFGAVETLLEKMSAGLAPADRMEWERVVARLHAQLDAESVAAHWRSRSAPSPEDAMALARR